MYCPLLKHRRQQELGLEVAFMADCLKEECAWWNYAQSHCALRALAVTLEGIMIILNRIEEKMPHA